MINTVIPETRVPSHQGPDAQTVIPDLDITTMDGAGPYNPSHTHFAMVETTRPVRLAELRDALWDEPRIAFFRSADSLPGPQHPYYAVFNGQRTASFAGKPDLSKGHTSTALINQAAGQRRRKHARTARQRRR